MYVFELILAMCGIGAWDAWKRYLAHKERVESLISHRHNVLVKELSNLQELLRGTTDEVGASIEKNRAILKTFLASMTDIVTLSEEEKSNLQNRLVAAKYGKK